jgi:hypothetical protein
MRKAFLALAAVMFLVSSSAAAQLVNSYYFIPVATHAAGLNGTFWQTDVTIANLGTSTVTLGMKFFPADVANTFTGFPVAGSIPPGQTVLSGDILTTYMKWVPMPGVTKGFMILADTSPVNCNVSSPPTSFPGLLAITSRTYNTGDAKGTYSTATDMNMAGVNFTTYPSVMPGVMHTGTTAPGFRTNLSVGNYSTSRIKILIKIFNSAGALAAPESPQTVESLSFRQWSFPELGVSNLGGGAGRVEVRLDPTQVADPCTKVTDAFCANPCDPQKCPMRYAMRSQPTFYAYASTIDNGTGDGTVISSFIDWQGYNKWAGDYTNTHCPSLRGYQNNQLSDWFRARGLIEPDPPPTFRKVGR